MVTNDIVIKSPPNHSYIQKVQKEQAAYVEQLLIEIEATRQRMYQAYEKEATSPEVLAISQQLDELLNELNRHQQ